MNNRSLTISDADSITDSVVQYSGIEGEFERVRPITDFRKDDTEARILYVYKRKYGEKREAHQSTGDHFYVLKCKVQAPPHSASGPVEPLEGPREHTAAELKALTEFTATDSSSLPHLVAWRKAKQKSDGLVPGGYIIYIMMTLMPGENLLDLKFWSMTEEEREEIRAAFLLVIKHAWRLGIEPYDCSLRNILWEAESRTLSLVDFEHWHPTTIDPAGMNEAEELQRWGLKSRPPPAYHWMEWNYSERLMERR